MIQTATEHITATMLPMTGSAIVRMTEKPIGPLLLDGDCRQRLARDRMGLLVAGVPSYESMVRRVAALKNYTNGRWIAVVASKELAATTEDLLESIDDQATNATSAAPWRYQILADDQAAKVFIDLCIERTHGLFLNVLGAWAQVRFRRWRMPQRC